MFKSDFFAADLALKIEEQFNVDMHLEEMFSDDLNKYYNYDYNNASDFFIFYFETEIGSCNIKAYYPFTDNIYYVFSRDIKSLVKKPSLNYSCAG